MKRRAFLVALGTAPWVALMRHAEGQGRTPRIGFLTPNTEGVPQEQGFQEGLRELGYVQGSSILIEWRRGKQEDLPALASELIRRQVDLIVTVGTPAARAASQATTTIPIVFLSGAPVSVGLAASIAHPDGNATGVSILSTELYPKRLEYLHLLAPRARRIAYFMNPSNPIAVTQLDAVQNAARTLGLQVIRLDVRNPDELDAAMRNIPRSEAGAVLIGGDALMYSNMAKIARAMLKAKLPAISPYGDHRDDGVLMSYGANTREAGRKMAVYVDKILKGTKPTDLPVEEISTYKLLIDLRIAREIGVEVPQDLLLRADEVMR
jgi:putative ABC transport system substrate-binding protein